MAQRKGVTFTCRYFGISRKTYYKWFNRYVKASKDPKSLQDHSRRPKTHPKTTSKEVVTVIIKLRKQTNFGPRRLQFYLKRDYNIVISICAIYKVLNRNGLIKRYKRRKKRFQSYAQYILFPGQKIQLDVKHITHPKKTIYPKLYQYSACDLFSKTRLIKIYDDLSANNTCDFVKKIINFFPFKIKCIQTDHGIEFTYDFLNAKTIHPLDQLCMTHNIKHVLSPVACPRYNGQVERSHRTDFFEEEFYRRVEITNAVSLNYKLLRYLRYYNEQRPHMSLNMLSPLQKLCSFKGLQHSHLNYKRCYP